MERLINQIIKEQQNNIDYQIPFAKEFKFFEQLFKCYCSTDMRTFFDITLEQILAIILIINNIKMPFEEVIEKTKLFSDTFDEDSDVFLNTFYSYVIFLEKLIVSDRLEEYIKLTKKYGNYKYQFNLKKIDGIDEDMDFFINTSLVLFSKKQINNPILEIEKKKTNYVVDEEKLCAFIDLYKAIRSPKPFVEFCDVMFMASLLKDPSARELLSITRKKDINKVIYQLSKSDVPETCTHLMEMFADLERYWNNLNTKKTRLEKLAAKNARINQELLDYLNTIDCSKLIVLNEKLLKLCTSPEIKQELLLYVNKHNLQFYKQTLEINQQYKNSSFSKLELLFIKYNFKFEKLSITSQDLLIESGDMNKIEGILEFLSKNNFGFIKENHKIFTDLLLYSSVDVLSNIATLVASDTITNKFVQDNPSILVLGNAKKDNPGNELNYEEFMRKILFFKEHNINLSAVVSLNPSLFSSTLEELQVQIEIVKKYGVNISKKGFELLNSPELLDLVDNYIELGLGDYIQNNPQLISTSKSGIIDRIIVSYKLGINIFNENHRITAKVTNPNKFYIPENQLQSFIINYSTNYIDPKYKAILDSDRRNVISNDYSELLAMLQPFENDELTYRFGNTLISKNRVLRNLEAILSAETLKQDDFTTILFQSILYKSLIVTDEKEIDNIYNILIGLPSITISPKVKNITE